MDKFLGQRTAFYEILHEFAGDVFAVGGAAAVTGYKQFSPGTVAFLEQIKGRINGGFNICQGGVTVY
jgi:hypothetical protein